MPSHAVSDNLSVTRINRLLRPLSVKCASLAAISPCEPTQTITYSTKSTSAPLPPFAVSRSQNNTFRSKIEYGTSRTALLAPAISHVRQAYANIVQAAFAEHQPPSTCPTLASMCAHVVGTNVIELEETEDEQEQLSQLVEFFETVPAHHRRWMLVSYATTLVLSSCSQHSILLYGLLETSLPYDLAVISTQILQHVLHSALNITTSQDKPSITHSTQSTYLIDLLSLWTDSGHPVYTFAQALSSVLATCSSVDIWTCRAMSKLLLALRGRCLASLFLILGGLVGGIAKEMGQNANQSVLVQCLLKWTRQAFELVSSNDPIETSEVLDFLNTVHGDNLHAAIFRDTLDAANSRDDNAIFCLALFCARTMGPHSIQSPTLLSLLGNCSPRRSVFNTLVTHILDPVYDYNFKDSATRIAQIQSTLQDYATFLVENDLCHLEPSLWLCALHYVEHPEAETSVIVRGSPEETTKWCRELVDLVDEAEKRAALKMQSPVKPAVLGKKRPRQGWENVLGCYVRKTVISPIPLVKVRQKKGLRHSLHSLRPSPKHKPLRRLSNFDTLLSDAQLNHRVVHTPKRRVTFDFGDQNDWENQDLPSPCPPRKKIFMSPLKREPIKGLRISAAQCTSQVSLPIPSSDDALDLFACDTSPVKP